MNTTITKQYHNAFIENFNIEIFNTTIQSFKNTANTFGLSSSEHILYNMLRNLPLERGFSPIINKIKLQNGQYANQAFILAKGNLKNKLSHNFPYFTSTFKLPEDSKEYWLKMLS